MTILVDIYTFVSSRSIYVYRYIHWQHYTKIWYSKKRHFLLSQIEKNENMKKKIIDYLIDYACPIISDNRLWNFSDCTSLVGTDYLFSWRARPENLFLGKPRTEYLFSTATNFWKSKKKKKKEKEKKKKKRGGGGGGLLVQGFSRWGRTWLSMFCITFCRLLASYIQKM